MEKNGRNEVRENPIAIQNYQVSIKDLSIHTCRRTQTPAAKNANGHAIKIKIASQMIAKIGFFAILSKR